jgi:hypothetical protein
MVGLLENMFHLIILLFEIAIALLLFDWIMGIICEMLGFSWKKVLMWAAAIFGILWLRDYIKKRKEKAQEEIIEELKDEEITEVVNVE